MTEFMNDLEASRYRGGRRGDANTAPCTALRARTGIPVFGVLRKKNLKLHQEECSSSTFAVLQDTQQSAARTNRRERITKKRGLFIPRPRPRPEARGVYSEARIKNVACMCAIMFLS